MYTHSIKNILIFYKNDCKKSKDTAKKLSAWFKEKKKNASIVSSSKKIKINSNCDLVTTIGGDGTYLKVAKLFKTKSIPSVGINTGSLGFLTHVSEKKMKSFFNKVFSKKAILHKHNLIKIKIKNKIFYALNDVSIERNSLSNLLSLKVCLFKKKIYTIKSDGIILSTALGSTAYNLAAGGPILHPSLQNISITPIAPHSLTVRPIVLNDNYQINIQIKKTKHKNKNKSTLSVDGKRYIMLNQGDDIHISKSPYQHYILRESNFNYFSILKEKFNFGERG
ncbi:MAG: NAD(+)/NADH kinase [Bdellovibrionales bacterium]|nr:NAD(+)/NADH kinase [Bdellovibrionales bacterium]